jgi:hypothetical protein
MPVFISHSHRDQASYTALCRALDYEHISHWDVASILAGSHLADQLRTAIEKCEVCVFLATRSSIESNWCLAEIGAFWGAGKRVIVYLSDAQLSEEDLPPQLRGNLWASDIDQLTQAIKEACDDLLDVFIAAPMAAYGSENEYQAARAEVLKVISALRDHCGLRVYCAVESCPTMKSFQIADVSVKKDFKAIRKAHNFVLIYPKKILSSVILEAGFALALRKFSVYFVTNRKDLPFMLQDAAGAFRDVALEELDCSSDYNGIVDAIHNNGKELFEPQL